MSDRSVDWERHRMERALAALAGSGLDSMRFTVLLDTTGGLGPLDRSVTAVIAVPPGGCAALMRGLDPTGHVAWVGDPWADPGEAPATDTAGEVMAGWFVGTVGDLRDSPEPNAGSGAGWLVLDAQAPTEATEAELLAAIEAAIAGGASPSRAAKTVAARHGVPKRRVYDLALSIGE